MKPTYLIFSMILLCFTIQLSAQNCNDEIHTGEGTFYGGVAGGIFGNCSLPVAAGDYMHCALNNIDYDGSDACGAFIEVTGSKGSVILKVVDRCPECAAGDVDMTEEAFEIIANVIDGRVPISWKFVPAETNSNKNIKINFKEGSSAFWTAIQFRDIKHAVAAMEYQLPDNTWQSVERELFNFFIETSGIPSPMNLRVTSILGEELVFENVSLNLNQDYDTQLQFSTPAECLNTLSVNDIAIPTTKFYPNPTSGVLFIQNNNEHWVLTDVNGKIIKEGTSDSIEMSVLNAGIYFISFDNKPAEKIIKQ